MIFLVLMISNCYSIHFSEHILLTNCPTAANILAIVSAFNQLCVNFNSIARIRWADSTIDAIVAVEARARVFANFIMKILSIKQEAVLVRKISSMASITLKIEVLLKTVVVVIIPN